jgi:hypothetical protein
MKKLFVFAYCLLHMIAITWWALPHSFSGMVATNVGQDSLEARLFSWMQVDDNSRLYWILQRYIDVTGSQQYWDFFAPQSPKYHQYLSVCDVMISYPDEGKIACKDKPLFSNLDDDFTNFKLFGSYRSRLYRLTENMANLEEPLLLAAFTKYYQNQRASAHLVLHQFELHPKLEELPKVGYRMDKLLWISY